MKDIDWACPADLRPYEQAYKLEDQKRENDIWRWCGNYGVSALIFAIDHCMNGRKAKSEYLNRAVDKYKKEEDYDTQIRKALLAEQLWSGNAERRHLPEPFKKKGVTE